MTLFKESSENFKIFYKYLGFLLLNLFFVNIILFYNFMELNKLYSKSTKNIISKTITEFDEIDLQHLCTISNCNEIGFFGADLYLMKNNKLIKTKTHSHNYIIDTKHLKINHNFNLEIFIYDTQIFLELKTQNLFNSYFKGYVHINIFVFILYTSIFLFTEYKMRRKRIIDNLNTSNTLREKNMQILTENIHHELNTPVAIIQGNIKKLEIEMSNNPDVCISCQRQFYFDFDQIYSSIEQIDTVLQRMSNFKNLKYSNGNKTLDDIIKYSANSMSIYKKLNFNIELGDDLNNYRLKGPLKNGDLLSIVSNHFRNSIEASATTIIVEPKFNKHTKKLHLYIIDNGTGLRDKHTGFLLQKDKYNDVFKPYYTSKNEAGISCLSEPQGFIKDKLTIFKSIFKKVEKKNIRGIGLYLNKELLNENDGDLKLRETSSKGTVFEIIIPIKGLK